MIYRNKFGREFKEEDLLEEALSSTTKEETEFMDDDEIIEYWMNKDGIEEVEEVDEIQDDWELNHKVDILRRK